MITVHKIRPNFPTFLHQVIDWLADDSLEFQTACFDNDENLSEFYCPGDSVVKAFALWLGYHGFKSSVYQGGVKAKM